jgi:ABC-2 type transport system permease protein
MSTAKTNSTTIPAWPVVLTRCERALVGFFRQKKSVFGALGQPNIFWLLFGAGLRNATSGAGGNLDYAHFFPGTLVMILLFTAIFATISIIEDHREGFLQGVLVAPIPRWAMVLGKVIGGAVIAMVQGIIFLLLGWLATALHWFDVVQPSVLGFIGAILLMFVISIALTALGFLIAWRMDSTQGFHAIMSVFLLPMWLLSGAFFQWTSAAGWAGSFVSIRLRTGWPACAITCKIQMQLPRTCHRLPLAGSFRSRLRPPCSRPPGGSPASEPLPICYEHSAGNKRPAAAAVRFIGFIVRVSAAVFSLSRHRAGDALLRMDLVARASV